jgi:hypothetical protein
VIASDSVSVDGANPWRGYRSVSRRDAVTGDSRMIRMKRGGRGFISKFFG